ncbi:hypothetical protein [Halovulum sp. GXIMD14793]
MLRLVELNAANLTPHLTMHVRADQKDLVAPNPITVAQCAYEPGGFV